MKNVRQNIKGFSLVEATIVLLLLSLVMIPVIKLVSNKSTDSSGNVYTAASASRILSEEQAIANTIMQKAKSKEDPQVALARGETNLIKNPLIAENSSNLGFNIGGDFVYLDPDTGDATNIQYTPQKPISPDSVGVPSSPVRDASNRVFYYPKYRYKDSNVFYQWSVADVSSQEVDSKMKKVIPDGNVLIKVVLRIFSGPDAKTNSNATFSLSSYMFTNSAEMNTTDFAENMGIVMVLDLSGSMQWAEIEEYTMVGKGTSNSLWTPTNTSGDPLQMPTSSGVSYDDIVAVFSPYLPYRQDVNDIFFGALDNDDPVTPYDERFDPCSTVNMPKLPSMNYSISGILPPTSCDNNLPAPDDEAVLVKFPTIPMLSIRNSIESKTGKSFDDDRYLALEKSCTDISMTKKTKCTIYRGSNPLSNRVALDATNAEMYRSYLFASRGNSEIIKNTISRIEAARSAMLSFVETIEVDPTLVDNFTLGFVTYSSNVQNENTINLSDQTGGEFSALKDNLFRINRACNHDGNNTFGVNCPGGKPPILPRGATNISSALLKAQSLFQQYETNNNVKFARKLVVLLTDGKPTAGVTSASGLKSIAEKMYDKDEINVYSIGLLLNDSTAINVLNSIGEAHENNTTVFVDNVASLASVFENIAQEAEKYMMDQIKDRYNYFE